MAGFLDEMVAWLVPAAGAVAGTDLTRGACFVVLSRTPGSFRLRTRDGIEGPALTVREAESFGSYALFSERVSFTGLSPDTAYEVELWQGDTPVDRCTLRTWPEELGSERQPFTLFLGSCYAWHTSSEGGNDLSQLVSLLRDKSRVPHAKILCGDQVYLDIPVMEQLPRKRDELRGLLARKYLENWQPHREDPRRSFGDLLRAGSNLFVTDDHEFWNNFPYLPSYKVGLWDADVAVWYADAARELAKTFQCVPPTLRTLTIGKPPHALSLAMLDGRVARSAVRTTAHAPEDLRALRTFLAAATGPAVVVLSQPLFEPAVSAFRRTIADRGLADLDDYGTLVDAVYACPHDVVLLSGDIHGGRVCSTFRARPGPRDQTLLEVVSSPLSLVRGGGYAEHMPRMFPADGHASGRGGFTPIERHFGPVRTNHGCLLQFWAYRDTVALRVQFLATRTGTGLGSSQRPFQLA